MEYVKEIGETTLCEKKNTVEIKIPLNNGDLKEMQKADSYCKDIANKLHKKQHMNRVFVMENGVLYQVWMEHDKMFKCILVPSSLRDPLLTLTHQHSGHVGHGRAIMSQIIMSYFQHNTGQVLRYDYYLKLLFVVFYITHK